MKNLHCDYSYLSEVRPVIIRTPGGGSWTVWLPPGDRNQQLLQAARDGDVFMVRALLQSRDRADVNTRDDQGKSALSIAVEQSNIELIRLLIDAAADVNNQELDGWSPLLRAAYNGRVDIVGLLMDSGADVYLAGQDDTLRDVNAMMVAAAESNTDVLKYLIDWGVDVNHGSRPNGYTPLMAAVREGNVDAVQILLEAGADVSARNQQEYGLTPLLYVFWNYTLNSLGIIDRLVMYGANVNVRDNEGRPIFSVGLAGQEDDSDLFYDIIKRLINAGSDPNARDPFDNNDTALMSFALFGDTRILNALIDRGAAVNDRNNMGKTALMKVNESEGDIDGVLIPVVQTLLDRGADINARDDDGRTALMQAIWMYGRPQPRRVQMWIDHGANVNIPDRYGNTPLMIAVAKNSLEIVAMLVRAGANHEPARSAINRCG